MNPETATLPDPTRIRHQTYGKLACGIGTISNYIQVLGLTTGKPPGLPAVASMQNSASVQGDWTPCYTPLTGATAPAQLTDLVVSAGTDYTYAVGLGSDGNIYVAGSQNPAGQWEPQSGSGLVQNSTPFIAGSLSAQPMNTVTAFALSSAKTPWVAAYRKQGIPGWNAGYALPGPTGLTYQSLAARPDLSNAGTTHAIGLTTDGKACEVATASGPGTGIGNWTVGKGILGSATGLPVFVQLLLVSGDSSQNFHVIGLGADGSVWDIDRYAAAAASPKWSGQSTRIVAPGSIVGSKIDFFLSSTAPSFTINLAAWAGSALTVFATFSTMWAPGSAIIPTSGVSSQWQVVNNLASGTGIFILGLSGVGLAYELACCNNGTWSAGSKNPISK